MADHDYSEDYVNNPGTESFLLTEEEAEVILGMRAKIKHLNLENNSHSERLLAFQLRSKLGIYLRQFSREQLADKLGITITRVDEVLKRLPSSSAEMLNKRGSDETDLVWLLRLADALDFHIRTSADSPDDLEREHRKNRFIGPDYS